MIVCYSGTVGSGKSYHAMYEALLKVKSLKRRTGVVANFPILFTDKEISKGISKRWHFIDGDELNPKRLISLSRSEGWFGHEGACLLIIDESPIYFNARDWQIRGDLRMEWVKFFAQSRKLGYDIILVAQDVRMIDRQIRSLLEYDVKHVKLRNYSWLKWLPVQLFAHVWKWSGGSFKGQPRFLMYKPWVARRYDTMRLFQIQPEEVDETPHHG